MVYDVPYSVKVMWLRELKGYIPEDPHQVNIYLAGVLEIEQYRLKEIGSSLSHRQWQWLEWFHENYELGKVITQKVKTIKSEFTSSRKLLLLKRRKKE